MPQDCEGGGRQPERTGGRLLGDNQAICGSSGNSSTTPLHQPPSLGGGSGLCGGLSALLPENLWSLQIGNQCHPPRPRPLGRQQSQATVK